MGTTGDFDNDNDGDEPETRVGNVRFDVLPVSAELLDDEELVK